MSAPPPTPTARDAITAWFEARANQPATVREIADAVGQPPERVRALFRLHQEIFAEAGTVRSSTGGPRRGLWRLNRPLPAPPPPDPAELWRAVRLWVARLLADTPGMAAPVVGNRLGLTERVVMHALDCDWFAQVGNGWALTPLGRATLTEAGEP